MDNLQVLLQQALGSLPSNAAAPSEGCDCADGFTKDAQGWYTVPCPRCSQGNRARREMVLLRSRLEAAGVAERYLNVDWGDLEMVEPLPRIQRAAGRIVEVVGRAESFALLGPTGCGKTQALMLMAKAAVQNAITVRVYNLGLVAIRVTSNWRKRDPELTEEQAIEEMVRPQLLLLDDLGAGESEHRDLERRMLYHVLEARAQKKRPTGLTSNLSPDDPSLSEFGAYLGARSLDRLKPLKVLQFRHGRNFRDRSVSAWD